MWLAIKSNANATLMACAIYTKNTKKIIDWSSLYICLVKMHQTWSQDLLSVWKQFIHICHLLHSIAVDIWNVFCNKIDRVCW